MFFVYLIIALAAGVALATQSAINTQLAKAMSGEAVIATFISFAVGTIVLFFIAWVKTDLWGNLSTVPSQPWWKLIGGILGAVVVFTTVLLAPKLGITAMLFFIIVGQLITATTIDHFGLIGMHAKALPVGFDYFVAIDRNKHWLITRFCDPETCGTTCKSFFSTALSH